MSEPSYIAQSEHLPTEEERNQWTRDHVAEAREHGATHCRLSVKRQVAGTGVRVYMQTILLLEAWIERPEDEGAPRFQLDNVDKGEPPFQIAIEGAS